MAKISGGNITPVTILLLHQWSMTSEMTLSSKHTHTHTHAYTHAHVHTEMLVYMHTLWSNVANFIMFHYRAYFST